MEFTHLSFKYAPLSCLLCVEITLGSHCQVIALSFMLLVGLATLSCVCPCFDVPADMQDIHQR